MAKDPLSTSNYMKWQQEIQFRRHWLLFHNQQFRQDFEHLLNTTNIKPYSVQPSWLTLSQIPGLPMPGETDPQWQVFYTKYGIGPFSPSGQVLARFGESPLITELLRSDQNTEFIRLTLQPEAINKKLFYKIWDDIKKTAPSYFSKNTIPWHLKYGNFWRDASWYQLYWQDTHWHAIKKSKLNDVVIQSNCSDPLIFDCLFLKHLLAQEKTGSHEPLLNLIDPGRQTIKQATLSHTEKLLKLLYQAGIFIICDTCIDWGVDFPYFKCSMVPVDPNDKLRKQGKFFVRDDMFKAHSQLYHAIQSELDHHQQKERIRTDFLSQKMETYLQGPGLSDTARVVREAITRLSRRIDSIV